MVYYFFKKMSNPISPLVAKRVIIQNDKRYGKSIEWIVKNRGFRKDVVALWYGRGNNYQNKEGQGRKTVLTKGMKQMITRSGNKKGK